MATDHKRSFQKRLAGIVAALLALAAAGAILAACGPRPTPAPSTPAPATSTPGPQPVDTQVSQEGGGGQVAATTYRLSVRLSEGQAVPQAVATVPVTTGVPLSKDAMAQLLARLPALTPEPSDQAEFKPAQGPVPPPLTGGTREQPFPPTEPTPAEPTPGPVGPLEVMRYAPEGDIPLAPFVSVTFSQPMVQMGGHTDPNVRIRLDAD